MKKNKTHTFLMIFALVLGIGVFGSIQTINAQQTKPKTEKKQKQDDDDNEKEPTPAEQAKLAQKAKITKEEAQAIALKKVPGEVIESEIEKEKGKLIWSFDIRAENGKIMDVEVDANTGTILKVEEDTEDETGDDNGNTVRSSPNKNALEKAASEIKNTTAKVFRKITGS